VALAFTAVAVIVVKIADENLVTQRVDEKLSQVNGAAIRMAALLHNMDSVRKVYMRSRWKAQRKMTEDIWCSIQQVWF